MGMCTTKIDVDREIERNSRMSRGSDIKRRTSSQQKNKSSNKLRQQEQHQHHHRNRNRNKRRSSSSSSEADNVDESGQILKSISSSKEIYSKINQNTYKFVNQNAKHLKRSSPLLLELLCINQISDLERIIENNLYTCPLFRDQNLSRTRANKRVVSRSTTSRVFSQQRITSMRGRINQLPHDIALIVEEPFSNLDMIIPGIYQTGIAGIITENILSENIKLIINATYEMPLWKHPEIVSLRVPVEDDRNEKINLYFDDVADLMEGVRLKNWGSVVHCMAGVSRSATLILAYMIKYTTFSLVEAFLHVKAVREPIRPNIQFLQQLIEYEIKHKGSTSIDMLEIKIDSQTVVVPTFYKTHYPDLYYMEIARQKVEGKSKKPRSFKFLLNQKKSPYNI